MKNTLISRPLYFLIILVTIATLKSVSLNGFTPISIFDFGKNMVEGMRPILFIMAILTMFYKQFLSKIKVL